MRGRILLSSGHRVEGQVWSILRGFPTLLSSDGCCSLTTVVINFMLPPYDMTRAFSGKTSLSLCSSTVIQFPLIIILATNAHMSCFWKAGGTENILDSPSVWLSTEYNSFLCHKNFNQDLISCSIDCKAFVYGIHVMMLVSVAIPTVHVCAMLWDLPLTYLYMYTQGHIIGGIQGVFGRVMLPGLRKLYTFDNFCLFQNS